MRVRLLEDIQGIGIENEQVGLDDSKALELIIAHQAIDVANCVPGAKEGAVALPIWEEQQRQSAHMSEQEAQAEPEQEEHTETRRTAQKK